MTETYLSLFKSLVRLTTQRILCFFDPAHAQVHGKLNDDAHRLNL